MAQRRDSSEQPSILLPAFLPQRRHDFLAESEQGGPATSGRAGPTAPWDGASKVQALVAPQEETSMDPGGTKRGGSRQARRRRQLAYPEEATQAAGPAEVSESPAKPHTREGPVI